MSGSSASANWARAGGDINVKAGLNEKETSDLFSSLLSANREVEILKSAETYFAALRAYCASSYQGLISKAPDDISLEEIYIPLRSKGRSGKSDTLLLSDALKSAFESDNRCIIVEGGPGSGKSTLLRQIARHAWADPEIVGLDRRYIAIPLRLRSLAEVNGASLEDRIWRTLDRARELEINGPRPPDGYFEAWPRLLDAPWLFLLDGFDEIPASSRPEVLNWVGKLVNRNASFILTSRPTDALPDEFRKSLTQFDVQPFSKEQQLQLSEKWLGGRANPFLDAFTKYSDGELGSSPLLLTIAAVVYKSSGELPLHRSELYWQFVTYTWQEAQTRGANEDISQELIELGLLCLQRIARKMTEERGAASTLDFGSDPETLAVSIADVLSAELGFSKKVAKLRAEKLLQFLSVHSGILRSTTYQFEWLHPTFREFLAAKEFATSTDVEVNELLARFHDVTWRQVVLFLIAIRSECGAVDPLLQHLKTINSPWGLALAGVAISEGANVEHATVEQVVREICGAIALLSKRGFCERLLTTDSTKVERLLAALKPFVHTIEMRPHIEKLRGDLVSNAMEYGRFDASGISDLQKLGAQDDLLEIAMNKLAALPVRASAARSLLDLGCLAEGYAGFRELALWASLEPGRWADLVRELAKVQNSDLFAILASSGEMSDQQWSSLLDAVSDDAKPLLLEQLVNDSRLSSSQRMAVELRTVTDVRKALGILFTGNHQPTNIRACVDILVRASDEEALLGVLEGSESTPTIQLFAFRGLERLKAFDKLRKLVELTGISYSIRRRAAETLYRNSLDVRTATILLNFFDQFESSKQIQILQRRSFLRYFLDDYEQAVALFGEVFALRAKTSFQMGIYGHCLQLLGRVNDALAAYGEALNLQADNSFARCQRAFMHWSGDDIANALKDVEHLKYYNAPVWFCPFASEILRRSERLEDAQLWLDTMVKEGADSLGLGLVLRCNLAFHRGRISEALADYRALPKLESLSGSDPFYIIARENLAKALRATGCFVEAVSEYSNLIDQWSVRIDYVSERAEAWLQLGAFVEADGDIANLRLQFPNESYIIYLEGLSKCLQGDGGALRDAAMAALLATPDDDGSESEYVNVCRSNRALYYFCLDQTAEAEEMLAKLISNRQFDQLRYFTVPYLESLTKALPNRVCISTALQGVKSFAWPEGWQIDSETSRRVSALKSIRRQSYPFPMYCQKHAIGGLDGDKELGERIFGSFRSEERAIALWTLGQADRLYGHCNFKKESDADYDLKFCDTTSQILSMNIRIFVEQFKVKHALFLEEDLLNRFDLTAKASRVPIKCSLVDLPPAQRDEAPK